MLSFTEIEAKAEREHGDLAALKARMRLPKSKPEILAQSDHALLAELSKVIFQMGFNWGLIDKKWPAFEKHFFDFNINRCAVMHDEELEKAMASGEIMKHFGKVSTVPKNAQWFKALQAEHGSVAGMLADFLPADYFKNLKTIEKQGMRVGIKTAQIWLRRAGVDAVVFSDDVIQALIQRNVIDKVPSSQKALSELQAYFDFWQDETGQSLNYLSQMLAFSVGERH